MYSSCLFCHSELGGNSLIEHLPVGRRVAYDLERGRMWVICVRCAGWNLTPFASRWEALEESERAYEQAKRLASTDQISWARTGNIDLIRIGHPTRPEFASWRYGSRFGKRRIMGYAYGAIAALSLAGVTYAGLAAGAGVVVFGYGYLLVGLHLRGDPDKLVAHIQDPNSDLISIKRRMLPFIRIHQRREEDPWELRFMGGVYGCDVSLTGANAVSALGRLMPVINRFGGSARHRTEAVELLERERDPLQFFQRAARYSDNLKSLPVTVRLALEMAAQEEAERTAMEGDLKLLEWAWRDAEELAAIADSLLVPQEIHSAWMRLKG